MKKLNKLVAALFAAVVVVASVGVSHAAFTKVDTQTKTASAILSSAGSVTFTIAVKNTSDNSAATDLTWTGVTLPTGWKNSGQYIELNTLATLGTPWGIRVVTDNKGAGAVPTYTGSNDTAGVLVDNTDKSKGLQLAWSIKNTVVGSTGPVSAKPYEIADGAGTTPQFQWLFMTDVANTTLPQGDLYRVAYNASGIHYGGAPTDFGAADSPNVIYLEANFGTAVTPRTYSTNRLTVESFTE